ncbi:sugar-binding transcriptional regulator [Corynebacterium sp. ES2794-CONJ1]|uniref:sugar-binding transcriptional regulator n=1 Tax=unclassified Corynebacterium TaxID=2624378 RepID=UPI0021679AC1|nr:MULTISPECIES: sugar-binding transcriptional regulator [unclassified Corynebacterium]MCS4490251.1 sugar-binding transcriptional regulator [Corynebacterium sp. ES2775-CONJ]MCS4491938.1 sugar-binding transcriptional regulator [Corynebacterium sp. ES2715-CONJ3]MCS4532043.1 sugar-binding transcriptional regulator [Corynebacterium sp. ES2730-CONJ]MCU9519444.1 sugar-binding transcriptional regulator [Corynebacterium sp. ES2794-CONJ1]
MLLRDEQSLQAAKLYYQKGLSQAEVAAEIGVSRPTVAKLLAYARQRGFVVIEIRDPRDKGSFLAEKLVEIFSPYGLEEARIVQAARQTPEEILKELGRVGALVLEEQVQDGHMVGVSWGNTMYAVAKALRHNPHTGVEIVQLKGGLSYTKRSTNDIETINRFCRAFDAYARTLPLPVIFDNVEVKRTVESDRHISHILDMGRHTDVVIFTVGSTSGDSLPLTLGYLSDTEKQLISTRAVGDACSRFFDEYGQVAVPSVDERTVGISLEDLASRPVRILVAGGASKLRAINTALVMGLASHLVIDGATALALIALWEDA